MSFFVKSPLVFFFQCWSPLQRNKRVHLYLFIFVICISNSYVYLCYKTNNLNLFRVLKQKLKQKIYYVFVLFKIDGITHFLCIKNWYAFLELQFLFFIFECEKSFLTLFIFTPLKIFFYYNYTISLDLLSIFIIFKHDFIR